MRQLDDVTRTRLARVSRVWWPLAVLILTGACTSAPSSTDPYQGTWAGSIVDRVAGTGTARLELRAGSRLEGSWTASVGGASLSGSATSDSSTGAQRSFAVVCGAQGSMLWTTMVSGGSLTGTYLAANCNGLSGGSLDLRRQ
jgi:hypothetical protein